MDRDIDIIRYEFLRLKLDTKTLDDTCIYIYIHCKYKWVLKYIMIQIHLILQHVF